MIAIPTRLKRPPFESAATVLYAVSVIVALLVTLRLLMYLFVIPGDTLGFMFGVLETRFLPSSLVVLLGLWSVAWLRFPPVWLRLACVPMAAWGVSSLLGDLPV